MGGNELNGEVKEERKKIRLKIAPRKFNDFLLIGILTMLLFAMELTLYFYNGIFSLNLLGILNDIAVYFGILMLISLIKWPFVKKILFAIIIIFFTFLFVVDMFYSRIFGNFSSAASLSSAKNIFKQDLSLIGFAYPSLLIAAAAAISFFFIIIIKLEKRRKSFFKITLPVVLSVVIAVTGGNIAAVKIIGSKTFDSNLEYYSSSGYLYDSLYNGKKFAIKFGYLNFRLKDLAMVGSVKGNPDIAELSLFFENKNEKTQNALTGKLDGSNIITIMAETLDTRIINPILTPNLYQFKTDSFVFGNYYVPTFFDGATINSEFMSQVGMLPVSSGWANNFGEKYYANYYGDYSLAGQLGNDDYDTYYFHNYMREFYNRNKMMLNWGFEKSYFAEDLVELGYENCYMDTSLLGFFYSEIIDFDAKFYVHITTYSMHSGFDEKYSHNLDFVKTIYPYISNETAVYYAKAIEFDAFVGGLIVRLEERGVLDNTAILIYPDHYNYVTPQIYQDIGADVNSKEIHRQSLMLRLPSDTTSEFLAILNGRKIDLVCSTIDITPTLLNLAVPDSEHRYFAGADIFDEKSIVFFEDYTICNGRSFMGIDLVLRGDESDREGLELALVEKITFRNLSPIIYDINYFGLIRTR